MSISIYIVIENGDPYPDAYLRYEEAVAAVKAKHKEAIDEELKWLEMNPGYHGCNEVDVPETKERSKPTRLYIEKGIHIEIHKYRI
jgi:hypothetical protein